jgi:hypothetical protein
VDSEEDKGMKLLVGGIIKYRQSVALGEVPDCHIRHLGKLSLSNLEVSWCWILDDLLSSELKIDCGLPDYEKTFINLNDSGPFYSRDQFKNIEPADRLSIFRRMAFLRNLLRERALLEGVDALVSIDSDICPAAGLLQQLVSAGKPWVSALVDNSALMNREHDPELWRMRGEQCPHDYLKLFNVMNLQEAEPGNFITTRPSDMPDLINGGECDATGAVCLYSRELLEAARWEEHMAGEDIGFSLNARRAGYKAHYIPLLCDHLMNEQRLNTHLQNCDICKR